MDLKEIKTVFRFMIIKKQDRILMVEGYISNRYVGKTFYLVSNHNNVAFLWF